MRSLPQNDGTLARAITLLMVGLIVCLVPLGRAVQRFLQQAVIQFEQSLELQVIGGVVGVSVCIALIGRVQQPQYSQVPYLHLVGLAGLLVTSFVMVHSSIEVAHLLTYALLTISCSLWFYPHDIRQLFFKPRVLVFASLISLLDEGLQGLHPDRVFDHRDLVLNLLGWALGTVLLQIFYIWFSREEARPSTHP